MAGSPVLIVLLVVGSLLSFLYAFQIYQFDHWRSEESRQPGPWRTQAVPLLLGIGIVALGLWPEPLLALSSAAADVLIGGAP